VLDLEEKALDKIALAIEGVVARVELPWKSGEPFETTTRIRRLP
jgi:hypothetical protein